MFQPSNPGVRFRLNSPLLPVLAGLLLLLQLVSPYEGWRIIWVGLGSAWLVSYLWVRQLGLYLTLRREIRFGWAQVGDRLEERFTLTNLGWLPALWVEIIDQSSLPGYQVSQATGLESRGRRQWYTQGVCTQRGVFQLGPTTLRSSDPLGFYTLEIHCPQTEKLIVTPPVVSLPTIEVAAGGQGGEGRPRPRVLEQNLSAAVVREYSPGDNLRWVHWRTSARRERLFVRLFEGAPAGDWWILLDFDPATQVGQGLQSTLEQSVILAASLADKALRSQTAVGLASNAQPLSWIPPDQGEHQRWEILRTLAQISPGSYPLERLLASLKPSAVRHASLIVITANVTGKWLKELIPLGWLGARSTILLLDPQAYGGQASAAGLSTQLTKLGVANFIIQPQVINPSELMPGKQGRLDWRFTPTGRAVLVSPAQDSGWKELR